MKIIVDEMPKTPGECMYSEFKYFPPCFEQLGAYKCKLHDVKDVYCNLGEKECYGLKTMK